MIEIKENFLSDENFKQLSNLVDNDNFPWFWNHASNYRNDTLKTAIENNLNNMSGYEDYPQFVHILFNNGDVNSYAFNFFNELLLSKFLKTGDSLLRVKINLNIPLAGYPINCISKPHVDTFDERLNKTSIYYLTDSDGDTIFFNETIDQEFNSLTIKQRFTPKANTLVTFNSKNIHSASLPNNTIKRMVINIVYGRNEI